MEQSTSRSDLLVRIPGLKRPARKAKARPTPEIWTILFTTFILLAGGLLYVWQHIQVIRLGYQVERLQAELAALVQEEKDLTLKIAQLKSLNRIEEIARRRLRMVEALPSQIVHVPSEDQRPAQQTGAR